MKRYILTGAPGSGKTSIIQTLALRGYPVVGEAATDIIGIEQAQDNYEPWKHPNFIDNIVELQKTRQLTSLNISSKFQFYDRSPLCTYALAVYLGFDPSKSSTLIQEIDRIEKHNIYETQVFFIENLGFLEPTAARTISFEESLIFEQIHRDTYAKFGFECISIPPIPMQERVDMILSLILNF